MTSPPRTLTEYADAECRCAPVEWRGAGYTFAAAVLLLLTACSGVPQTRTGAHRLPEIVPRYDVVPSWYRQAQGGYAFDPVLMRVTVAGGRCYFVDTTGYITALDANTGARAWRLKPPAGHEGQDSSTLLSGALAVSDDLVLAGTHEGELLALDATHGRVLWHAALSSEVLAPPTVEAGVVMVHSNDGRFYALSTVDGHHLWTYDSSVPALSLRGSSRPLIADGRVIGGLDNGKIVALTSSDGQVQWETTVAVPEGRSELERLVDIDADPLYVDGVVYAAAYHGRVVALSALSGRILWSRDISVYTGMAVSGDLLIVSGSDGTVWGLARDTGAVLWRQDELVDRTITAPVIQSGQIAIGDAEGFIHWLTPDDGGFVARSHVDDVGITSLTTADDILYAVSATGEIQALRLRAVVRRGAGR
jgi:outer membrane protein assembly factor BamB